MNKSEKKKTKPKIDLSDNFVLVMKKRPNMEIQVLDDRPEKSRLLIKRIVLGVALIYNAIHYYLEFSLKR